jgi:hypothetical protein
MLGNLHLFGCNAGKKARPRNGGGKAGGGVGKGDGFCTRASGAQFVKARALHGVAEIVRNG